MESWKWGLLLLALAALIWFTSSQQGQYPEIDPSRFSRYIAVHVPALQAEMHTVMVQLPASSYGLDDNVVSQLHVAVMYNGRFVELPSVVEPIPPYYRVYFRTPISTEHTVYILLDPDYNFPHEDRWEDVFVPDVNVVTLSPCNPDLLNPASPFRVSARYDPDTRKVLVAIGEHFASRPYSAQLALYALDPDTLSIIDSYCISPSASVIGYYNWPYSIDASPDGSYFVGFAYTYDSGGYVYWDDWELYQIRDGTVVRSFPMPANVKTGPVSIELDPDGAVVYGAKANYGYAVYGRCFPDTGSCSVGPLVDFTYGSPVSCTNDTRDNVPASIWCTSSGQCVGMVAHSYCTSEYSYTTRWDLVENIQTFSPSAKYHNLSFDPSRGQKYGDAVAFYQYAYNMGGNGAWSAFTRYPYYSHGSWITNGKFYSLGYLQEFSIAGVPGVTFGSDNTHIFVYSVGQSPDGSYELNVYSVEYKLATVPLSDVSSPQPVSQVPVFLRVVPQHYRLAHYVIDVDVNEPGTYDVFLLLDGNLVSSYTVDLSGSTTLDFNAPVSVPPESNHTLTVTLARDGFQVGRSDINAVFLPALLLEYSRPEALTQNQPYTFSISYQIYGGDTSTVDFNIQGTLYNVSPVCTPADYNMLSCTAEYNYVPGSAGDLDYQYIVRVTVDGNTYSVSTPIYTATVSPAAPPASPPARVSGPAPTEARPAGESPEVSVQPASPLPAVPTWAWLLAVVVALFILYSLTRKR